MKLLFCSHCHAVKPLKNFGITICHCRLCWGFYLTPKTKGQAIFYEFGKTKPKYLWVIGISNDWLATKKPDYKIWKKYKNHGKQFKKNKSVIIRVRPSLTSLKRKDIYLVPSFKKFILLWFKRVCRLE